MQVGIDQLRSVSGPLFFIAAAGFEDRTTRALELVVQSGIALSGCLLLTYAGDEHNQSLADMTNLGRSALSDESLLTYHRTSDRRAIAATINAIPASHLLLIDITGIARHQMLQLLSTAADLGRRFWVIYTEAEEYYPTQQDLERMLGDHCLERGDIGEAFFKLAEYEEADLVYSANCSVEEVHAFPGRHLPNYPLLLIAFLTFKRSRLSAVLREYEASTRVLIEGSPVRADLAWRKRAVEIINFDLIEEYRKSVKTLNTLDWRDTRDCLEQIYHHDENCYRYNVLLAPLGSKMQTVGAWAFARRHPEVKVITSTPTRHFSEKYSVGWRDTFMIDDLL